MRNDPGELFPRNKKKVICMDEVNKYMDSADELFPQIIKLFTQLGALEDNMMQLLS